MPYFLASETARSIRSGHWYAGSFGSRGLAGFVGAMPFHEIWVSQMPAPRSA